MPRTARLDIPNILQHVIVRGIERRDIFLGDDDRQDFVCRLDSLLEKTEVECLAWSLLSNHFHLLLRPTRSRLAPFMRRLLTGYAVAFNLRHSRSGHLFQNRYKSLVCDEDSYLLELVRYIHLNPLRAGLVRDLPALERFPWSGHAGLMGKGCLKGQRTDEVLCLFGRTLRQARRKYQNFVADGVHEGKRSDLVGGPIKNRGSCDCCWRDSRILGDEDFVERVRSEPAAGDRLPSREPLDSIIAAVAGRYGVSPQAIASRSRMPRVLNARGAVCHAAFEAGHSGASVARRLGMSRSGVLTARNRFAAFGVDISQFQCDEKLE